MKYKPHIRMDEGLWCVFPRRTARRPVIVCSDMGRCLERAKKRHDLSVKSAQDREAGRKARLEKKP